MRTRLVLDTLTPLDGERKCFRMINGVLVERTVKDVLPALQTNAEGLKKVLEDLVKQYQNKQAEMEKWKVCDGQEEMFHADADFCYRRRTISRLCSNKHEVDTRFRSSLLAAGATKAAPALIQGAALGLRYSHEQFTQGIDLGVTSSLQSLLKATEPKSQPWHTTSWREVWIVAQLHSPVTHLNSSEIDHMEKPRLESGRKESAWVCCRYLKERAHCMRWRLACKNAAASHLSKIFHNCGTQLFGSICANCTPGRVFHQTLPMCR